MLRRFVGIIICSIVIQGLQAEEITLQEKVANPEETATSQEKERTSSKFSLSYYEPMYFAYGEPTSRVNFSFMRAFSPKTPLYVAYVQNIFWYMTKKSSPFKDADFNPRFLYRLSLSTDDPEDFLDLIAYDHKSNGKSRADSRSYNGTGAKISQRWEFDDWSVKTTLKGIWRFMYERSNRDFYQYVGPFDLGLVLAKSDDHGQSRMELSYRLNTTGGWGEKFNRLTHEVGLTIKLFNYEWAPSLYLHYYNGYGEALVDYKTRREVYRVGFVI